MCYRAVLVPLINILVLCCHSLCCVHSYVEGLAELVVRSGSDIALLQDQGNKVRRMASTDMNDHSSRCANSHTNTLLHPSYRSHSVFIVHVKQRDEDDSLGQGLTAKINLVDLAGSERQGMAGTEGQTLREGAYINKRLLLLLATIFIAIFGQ